jgi:hypothetical protein
MSTATGGYRSLDFWKPFGHPILAVAVRDCSGKRLLDRRSTESIGDYWQSVAVYATPGASEKNLA